jgi:hypothetical protein
MPRMTWSFKAGARHKWRRRTRPRSREPAHVTHCATFADASLLYTLCGIRSMACLSQCTWMSDASNSSLREIFVVDEVHLQVQDTPVRMLREGSPGEPSFILKQEPRSQRRPASPEIALPKFKDGDPKSPRYLIN